MKRLSEVFFALITFGCIALMFVLAPVVIGLLSNEHDDFRD